MPFEILETNLLWPPPPLWRHLFLQYLFWQWIYCGGTVGIFSESTLKPLFVASIAFLMTGLSPRRSDSCNRWRFFLLLGHEATALLLLGATSQSGWRCITTSCALFLRRGSNTVLSDSNTTLRDFVLIIICVISLVRLKYDDLGWGDQEVTWCRFTFLNLCVIYSILMFNLISRLNKC